MSDVQAKAASVDLHALAQTWGQDMAAGEAERELRFESFVGLAASPPQGPGDAVDASIDDAQPGTPPMPFLGRGGGIPCGSAAAGA